MRLPSLLLLTALLVACGSADNKPTLSALSPAGDACPSGGGIVTSSGVDDDGDGVLDESEIDERVTLCAADTLTRLDAIAPGEICPNGGTSIKAGTDDDRNGLLGDAEVDTTQNLCKGTIVRTTPIAPTEPACLGFGGVLLEMGVDDDADDILDADEVDLRTVSCNGATETQRPASPPGASHIYLDGGDSIGGGGGDAGNFYAELGASGGGTLALFDTGVADASFTMPSHTPIPGATNLPVNADLTIAAWTGAAPAVGTPFTFSEGLYISTGNATPANNTPVTSVTIAAGVTLSLDAAVLRLNDDLVNHGTLLRAGAPTAIELRVRNYVGGPGSKIDTAGGAGVAGGTLLLVTRENVYNQGTFDASGGAGTAGGGGGLIQVEAGRSLYNTGDVISVGGESTAVTSTGPQGGQVSLNAYGGSLSNSGDVVTTGGQGTRQGGAGNTITLYAAPGTLRNSGNLTANGAAPKNCAAACRGGDAGVINVESRGGAIFTSGELSARGASVTAADGCGGQGNQLNIAASYDDGNTIVTLGQGTVHISGTIDLRGGDGGTAAAIPPCSGASGGGLGGNFNLNSTPLLSVGQEVIFYGYLDVSATGGTSGGAFAGRLGGGVSLYRYGDYGEVVGSIQNWVPVTVSGGGAATAQGGAGGYFGLSFGGGSGYTSGNGANNVRNYAVITNDGGTGGIGGGVSGDGYAILLHGPEGVTNTAELRVRGGTGTTGGGGPGEGPTYRYAILMSSDVGTVTNTAALTADGGDGATHGGGAGEICLEGISVSNTAPMSAVGGNAGAALEENGSGNHAWLKSFYGASSHTGTFSGAPGTGGTGGVSGELYLDVLDGRCYQYND